MDATLRWQKSTERLEIFHLRNEKLMLCEISNRFRISINAVHQALKHIRVNGSEDNTLRKERPQKTTPRLNRTGQYTVCQKQIDFKL